MATQSNRPPIFGMNCTQCGDLLIAPEWSEYEDERHILNLWSCTNCGCQFETEALLPAAKAVSDAATMKAFSVAVSLRGAGVLPLPAAISGCAARPWAFAGSLGASFCQLRIEFAIADAAIKV